jgi:oligosaccharyltransferase complex subunit delta (ribophorin II)
VIASFGSSSPSNTFVFTVNVKRDPKVAQPATDKPLRYGKLQEINHIFRADPKSPPLVITLAFAGAAIATIPVLLGAWFALGANVNHLSEALNNAPVAHALFLGSIVGMEGIFFMYYSSWNLFQTLPAATVASVVAILSGSRALTEVQGRRLAGKR